MRQWKKRGNPVGEFGRGFLGLVRSIDGVVYE